MLSRFVDKLPLSRWQCCLMMVLHVPQTNESPFVCSHCALLCTWHHFRIFNSDACGFVPGWESWLNLCLVPNLPHKSLPAFFIGDREISFLQTFHKIALTFFEIKYCMKFKMYAKSMERRKNPGVTFSAEGRNN